MDAKVCDICGKTFIPGLGKDHHVLGHVVRNEIILRRYEISGGNFKWDICNECIDAFDAWVRNRMKENNNA